MKLCTFTLATPVGHVKRVGVIEGETVVDATLARIAYLETKLPLAAAIRVGAAQVPADMIGIVGSGPQALEWLGESVDHLRSTGREETGHGGKILHRLQDVKLLAPIPRPPGIACFVTWSAHIEDSQERGYTMLQFPDKSSDMRAYYKANPDAVEAPGTRVPLPSYATEMDVECEMAAVVGVGGKDLSLDEARHAIVGYTIFNDISYRAIQLKEMKFGLGPTKGKDADHSNVLGPYLVTADEVGDPQDLQMSFAVNGKLINEYHTSQMAWSFADLVSYLSRGQTLHAGHIVTSGSFPGGSGLDADLLLNHGDVVSMSIDKLGSLESTLG